MVHRRFMPLLAAVLLLLSGCGSRPANSATSSSSAMPEESPSESVPSQPVAEESSEGEELLEESSVPSSQAAPSSSVPQSESSVPSQPVSTSSSAVPGAAPIAPAAYQQMLGHGMDVDWSKTQQGRQAYTGKVPAEFAAAGVKHVRIRVKDAADEVLFASLDRQIDDCLEAGLIPVLAYQADEFKNDPSQENREKVVAWWDTVARHYQDKSHLLSFDLLIEATDAVNKQPEALNALYEETVSAIRESNPTRILFISPRTRSDPQYLKELAIPTRHNGYLMAEWHFYASGPSKENEKKLWTTGTPEEQALILEKIDQALAWQKQTGVPTWVGAWMPGNYNDGDDYTVEEQVAFAAFVTRSLGEAGIPFAVNSDTKFYDRDQGTWIQEMQPVFAVLYQQ